MTRAEALVIIIYCYPDGGTMLSQQCVEFLTFLECLVHRSEYHPWLHCTVVHPSMVAL